MSIPTDALKLAADVIDESNNIVRRIFDCSSWPDDGHESLDRMAGELRMLKESAIRLVSEINKYLGEKI